MGIFSKAKKIFVRAYKELADSLKEPETKIEYGWIEKEVLKEATHEKREKLILGIISYLNEWYIKCEERGVSEKHSLFYARMLYFLYTIESFADEKQKKRRNMSIDIPWVAFSSLLEYNNQEINQIIKYLVKDGGISLFFHWEEYEHIQSKKAQDIERKIEKLFAFPKETEVRKKYYQQKQAYNIMKSLLQ
ncbi:hypothetical protein NEFER03_2042 [Nematocida sp. LUAm3]|nr:hypothetical protein NEFER03_2042 [Nematocida sp. LUAm3]KAI5174516.1 hypothetical protein NEFER02_0637 [Nematocida sp. LUAm2]KAI5179167.1 hypothetical protein NEFER01_2030 [Nematocida sp. LUAm1]